MIFAIMLLSHLISLSINNNKKQIGILRSLGVCRSDIESIYIKEGLLIGVFSLIISTISCYYIVKWLNTLYAFNYEISISPIIFNNLVIIWIGVILLCVVLASTLVPCYSISKMKPIDSINNL